MGGFLAFAALHAEESGLANASLPLVVYGGTVVIGRIVFGRYVDRVPPLRLGAAALAVMGVGLILLALVPTPAGVLVGSAVTALGVVFSTPAFFSAIFATARPSERAVVRRRASPSTSGSREVRWWSAWSPSGRESRVRSRSARPSRAWGWCGPGCSLFEGALLGRRLDLEWARTGMLTGCSTSTPT